MSSRSNENKALAEKHQVKQKTLGDPVYRPFTQDLGTLQEEDGQKLEVFKQLARGYVVHGDDRSALCAANAKVGVVNMS
jgi:hypothetical protein